MEVVNEESGGEDTGRSRWDKYTRELWSAGLQLPGRAKILADSARAAEPGFENLALSWFASISVIQELRRAGVSRLFPVLTELKVCKLCDRLTTPRWLRVEGS